MKLTKSEALKLAREECEARGLPFVHPVNVLREFPGRFRVWTNADHKDANVVIRIDRRSKQIVDVTTTGRKSSGSS